MYSVRGSRLPNATCRKSFMSLNQSIRKGREVAMAMAYVWREEGMKKGMELGKAAALSETALQVLIEKFGRFRKI